MSQNHCARTLMGFFAQCLLRTMKKLSRMSLLQIFPHRWICASYFTKASVRSRYSRRVLRVYLCYRSTRRQWMLTVRWKARNMVAIALGRLESTNDALRYVTCLLFGRLHSLILHRRFVPNAKDGLKCYSTLRSPVSFYQRCKMCRVPPFIAVFPFTRPSVIKLNKNGVPMNQSPQEPFSVNSIFR